jgi:biotin carboxylase
MGASSVLTMSPEYRGRRLLILGAGKWHVPSYQKAREMNLHLIGVDTSAAPGFDYCDESHLLDLRDAKEIARLARSRGAEGIVTNVDLAVPTVAQVAGELGLPAHSMEVAHLVTDKGAMRRRCHELGLGGPISAEVRSLIEARQAARATGFPCVFKPRDAWGSRGVTVVMGENDIEDAHREAFRYSLSGGLLVEELLTGTESSVEGFVDGDGRLHILGICDKQKSDLPYRYDLELHYPSHFDSPQVFAIREYVSALVRGFGIRMGFIHTELMVKGQEIKLIETAARGCGGNVIGRLIPAITGLDVLGLWIRQALGEWVMPETFSSSHGLLKFIMVPAGRVRRIRGIDEARRAEGIIDFGLDVREGDDVAHARNTSGRVGHLIAVGGTRDETDRRAARALERLHLEVEEAA